MDETGPQLSPAERRRQRTSRIGREPIFNLPPVIVATALVLLAVHGLRSLVDDLADLRIIMSLAVVPARWSVALGAATPADILASLAAGGERAQLLPLAEYVLAEEGLNAWSILTHALLHGSWMHLLVNLTIFVAFGTPLARRLGTARFLLLAGLCVVAGAAAYMLAHPLEVVFLLGASSATSGLMAAVAWFVFAPSRFTLQGRLADLEERPRLTWRGLLRSTPARVYVVTWFILNFAMSLLGTPGSAVASVPWEPHAAGFLVGLLLFPLLDPLPQRRFPES